MPSQYYAGKHTDPTGIIESIDSISRDGTDTPHKGAGLDQYTDYALNICLTYQNLIL